MIKFIKKNILGIIIGVVIGITSVVIAESINSNEVLYDNSDSVSDDTTVKGALDSLFDIVDHSSTGFSLLAHNTTGISSNLIAELYRYQGTYVNNYICFGTTIKGTCTGDTDKYMYRIMGINQQGQLKIIKKEALNTAYAWHSPGNGVDWYNSTLYAGLNGNYFLTNTSYVPSDWVDRIAISPWHYYRTTDSNILTIAERELSAPTVDAKIGLFYLHDIAYAMENATSYGGSSWLNITMNDSNPPGDNYSWTITKYPDYGAWRIHKDASISGWNNERPTHAVRPVFFLKSTEKIASGSGTLSDPYILEDVS